MTQKKKEGKDQQMNDKAPDYKSFKFTLETLNPMFMDGINTKKVTYGSNYFMVMTTGEDTFTNDANGYNYKSDNIENIITALHNDNSVPLFLTGASAWLTLQGWAAEDIRRLVDTGIYAHDKVTKAEAKEERNHQMDDKAPNYKSFKITIETLDPEFLEKVPAVRELYGSNYFAIVTTEKDKFSLATHGRDHKLETIQNIVIALDHDDSLPLLLAEIAARLNDKGWTCDKVIHVAKIGIDHANCRDTTTTEEGNEAPADGC